MKKILLSLLVAGPLLVQAQTFSDDFESYTAGQYIGPVSAEWTTWSGTTGGSEDVQVTTANASSGTNSIYFSSTAANGGPQDVLLLFGGTYNTGTFSLEMDMFVNTNKGAYFNWQGTSTPGQTYTMDVTFQLNGDLDLTSSGSSLLSATYPHNTWFNVRIDVNLNTSTWELFIDNVSQGTFQNTTYQIHSMDLFPLQNHQFYVDDVQYTYTPYTLPATNGGVLALNNLSGLATQNVTPSVVVRNLGTNAITSFDVTVDYNGSPVTENVTSVNIPSLGTYTVNFAGNITLIAGTNPATATISNVNGAGADADPSDDVKTLSINPLVPAAGKMVVAEEGTGTWCGWCPRGAVYMDMMTNKYDGFFAPIAVHNGDPMVVTAYDAAIGTMISGYPSALVDRGADNDPSMLESEFLNRIVVAPTAFLVNGATYNTSTRELKVSVTTTFNTNESGDWRIALVLTEDAVTGTTSQYNQSNYYAGGSNGVMGGYESLTNPVPAAQMVYDHVARAISPGFAGQLNSFPSSIVSGTPYTLNFTFTLPTSWDENEMHIIGMLVDPTDKIDNASNTTIAEAVANGFVTGSDITGVQTMEGPDATMSVYPNPANNSANISLNLTETSNVKIEIFAADGKLVAAQNYGELTGAQVIPLNTAAFQSGLYLVKLTTNTGVITKQLVKE